MSPLRHALLLPAILSLTMTTAACPADEGSADTSGADTSVAADTGSADTAATTDTSTSDTVAPADELRVISLNLRCLIDDWDARLPILVDALAAADPHLLGLQEACAEPGIQDALPELLAALSAETGRTYDTHRTVTHTAWDTYEEGLAIASALPLDETAVKPLPGGVFSRRLLLARVTRPGGGSVVFATTHFDHQSTTARKGQASAVVAALESFAQASEAVVLTGDLNEGPAGGDVHSTLTAAGLVDLWGHLEPTQPGHSFPASNPNKRIDYVWVNATAARLEASRIHLILLPAPGAVSGSDHLGLFAGLAR